MVSKFSAKSSSTSSINVSVRGTITSRASFVSRESTPCIIVNSEISIAPSLRLLASKDFISLRVNFSSTLENSIGVIRFNNPVENVKIHTNGFEIFLTNKIIPAVYNAICSAICNATCFGYNSPNTKVRYARTTVTITSDNVSAPGMFPNNG